MITFNFNGYKYKLTKQEFKHFTNILNDINELGFTYQIFKPNVPIIRQGVVKCK